MFLLDETEHKLNGLTLHTIKTDKFKTNTIVLRMKAPLQEEYVTQRALLPYVLQSETPSYPSTTSLRSYLDELYGASLYVDLAKKGENHIITFFVEIANELFLKDQTPLLDKAIALLKEIVLSPVTENGAFKSVIVEKEKRSQKQRIQAVNDDKMRYSNLRLVEEMCKDEPYHLHVNGRIEDIDSITTESLYNYYQKVITEDEIDLYIIGNIEPEKVKEAVSSAFVFSERNKHPKTETHSKQIVKENKVIEKQDVKQGKLNIGYRTHTTYSDPDYDALQVFNGIFGGFSHSKLFINVREKESLAYYAASRVESHKGLLMVMSGIDDANYDRAVTIIKEQMQAMADGDFTDDIMDQTKAVIRNQLLETIDTSRGIAEVLYHNVVSSKSRKLEDWISGIETVTKDEVVKVAKKIQLDTIYFLTGLEGGR
ncbi:EF-P 5-aminopentanol modification-associated protein YfmF [Bacillus sp. REN16]|uniref:EF-P 5-aminopentanol modification-associated protein YfmF n=1 Tax=Bacillus sp. REN16 TaxID=2887296 RepID=UPI001E46FECD|nr:pitrilysin family protein [Bacillus sp. REN16]MCC3359657.1 insulinase family protein [Bacillus sp. REN16]